MNNKVNTGDNMKLSELVNQVNQEQDLNKLVDKLCNDLTCAMHERWSHADNVYYYAKKGSKYIKIIKDEKGKDFSTSVWGFINVSNDKFEFGDVLKASSWSKPALNKARGNLFEEFPIDPNSMIIYGPRYL